MANRSIFSRRQFLESAALGAGAAMLGRHAAAAQLFAAPALPDPRSSGIDHVVVVMMENRSFDHLLGWLPGADGRQAGLTYFDRVGLPHDTAPLAPRYVAVVKRWAAGASVNALKLEPPAYLTTPAPTPSEACCCAERAMGAIARNAEKETGPKCMGPVRYSATENCYA